MRIEERKDKYPDVEFYELKKEPEKNKLELLNIEDVFRINKERKTILYYENYYDEDTVRRIHLYLVCDMFVNQLPEKPVLFDTNGFVDFCLENLTERLRELIKGESYASLDLYECQSGVFYHDEGDEFPEEEQFEIACLELPQLYDAYLKHLEDEKQQQIWAYHSEQEKYTNEIKALILNFKEMYEKAESKKEKEEIVRKIQLELFDKKNLDARSDRRASKVFIIQCLEEKQ